MSAKPIYAMSSLVPFLAYIFYLIYVIDLKSGIRWSEPCAPLWTSRVPRGDEFRWPRVRGKKKTLIGEAVRPPSP